MKDLSLSPLSRGCGRFVSSNRNTGRHERRLEVCITPQDYYMWKSQDSLLRLSNSGRLLVEAESALPKTYSTRRGPLLLYSQDFVTSDSSSLSETTERKQRVVQQYTQQVGQQLNTVRELSAAILTYNKTKFTSSRHGPLFYPPLHLPLAADLHHPSPLHTTQEQSSLELLVQSKPQLLPAERSTVQLGNQTEDKEEGHGNRKRIRLDLFLQSHCNPRTPQMTSEEPEEPQPCIDMCLQHTESSTHAAIKHHSIGGEQVHPVKTWVSDMADNQGCSIQDSGMTDDKGNHVNSLSGNRHGRIGLLPPLTVGHSVCNGPCWEKTDMLRWEGPSSDEHHARRLPPIAEGRTVAPGRAIQTQSQQDAQPKAESLVFQSQGIQKRPHQWFRPLLFPGKEEMSEKQRGGGGETERQYYKKGTIELEGGRGGRRLPSEKGSLILLEPWEEPPPPGGVLGGVAGRKGPGKQSSLAFLQNRLPDLQDPCGSSDANRGVVRGVLPLELRDLQNGKPVGCLILGPDGEIIRLSLYDNSSREPSHADSDTHILSEPSKIPVFKESKICTTNLEEKHIDSHQVLSAEGEKLPCVIVLEPKQTPTDLHRLTETNGCSPSNHTNPVPAAVTNKKTKGAEAVAEILGKDAQNNLRMPLLREQVGGEEPRGGNTEAEEEEEEQIRTGQTSHLSGSHQPGQQNICPNEAATEDAVDKRRKNPKRKDADHAATTTGEMKTVKGAASDRQKTSRTRTEGRQRTKSDIPSVRRQKQEERTSRDTAETQGHSAPPSVKKRMTDVEEERGEVKMKEEREASGEVTKQKEESAGRSRRRRGRLKHEEGVVGNHEDPLEKVDVEIGQEISVKKHSATERHNKKTNAEEDTEAGRPSTNADEHKGVQASQSNRRSSRRSAASPCEEASSHGRLSSCSTVKVTEQQLMLNPVKPEFLIEKTQEEKKEAAALRLAQRAERRRQEVERKRREREEEERKQQERELTEGKMKRELEEERRKRAEELRLKKLAEEEERRKREEEEQERARQEQAHRERERRRQEERRRQVEQLQRMREEEDQRRRAELKRLRLETERSQEEEGKKLQEMDEGERMDYLCRKEQGEENRRNNEEEHERREEEAALQAAEEAKLQAELLARQMALLQQQLAFKRGLVLEAGGLEKTQGISRPWIYSYFTLLELPGGNPAKAVTMAPDL